MYLNAYQRYIAELLDEYGALLVRQLLSMVNYRFETDKKQIDGYIDQMCRFGDYELDRRSKEPILCHKGTEPDFDMIRSFEVLLAFLPKVIFHYRDNGDVTISFLVQDMQRDKEISVVPVRIGMERQMSLFVVKQQPEHTNRVIICLLEDKEQIKKMQASPGCKLALIDKTGVSFFKR